MTVEPIALVGVGCALPRDIRSVNGLAAALRAGRDHLSEIPPDRWNVDQFYDPDPVRPGTTVARRGGFLRGVDEFDAAFFGISGAEAARMDPQQRLLLQTVWHAIEDAGQNPQHLKGTTTGVFLGASNTNAHAFLKLQIDGLAGLTGYDATSDALSVAAGRVASFFGLQGPCLTVDTACSSSLVALHLARQAILAGECDTAIVAGVNLIVHPATHIAFSQAGLLSRRGQLRAFDADANGYVRSEGCLAVVLRRESEALARRDRILASVLGTALTHHGRSIAITAPDGRAQERVMRAALDQAGVHPGQVDYVEAHGTGTPVGDPMELASIATVYGPSRPSGQPLHVGSVKTHFGHLEAAGLLGLVKAALCLDRETIFPNVHFDQPNPKIDLRGADIRIPTASRTWPRISHPRRAQVNSFGYSGTNAAAVLGEAPRPAPLAPRLPRPHELLVLSASSRESLAALADRWAQVLSPHDPLSMDGAAAPADPALGDAVPGHAVLGDAVPGDAALGDAVLGDAAFTAAAGRAVLRHRLAVVGQSAADTVDSLRRWRAGHSPASVVDGRARPHAGVAFVFTGQGSQYPGMGRGLYDHEPTFAAAIDRCATVIDPDLGRSLHDVLFGEHREQVEDTRFAQPALFAIEYALATLLDSWGVVPAVVLGHSVGEIAAACVAGLLTFEDAAAFAVTRGRLMGALPDTGRMLAVAAAADVVQAWLADRSDVVIAGVYGPRSVVVSGTVEAVDEVARRAGDADVRTTAVAVSHAFHSPLMDPVLPELDQVAARFTRGRTDIPMVSTVTGAPLTGWEGPAYWSTQARQPVRLHDALGPLLASGCAAIVEIGPHPALSPAIAGAISERDVRLIPTLHRHGQDVRHLLEAAGALFVTGAALDPPALFDPTRYQRTTAPLYPFERDRYWFTDQGPGHVPAPSPMPRPPGDEPDVPVLAWPRYEAAVTTSTPWADHRVLGRTVFPATGFVELVVRACTAVSGADLVLGGSLRRPVVLRDVQFSRPLVLTPGRVVDLGVGFAADTTTAAADTTDAAAGPGARFVVHGGAEGEQTVPYCRGVVHPADPTATHTADRVALDQVQAASTGVPIGRFYGSLRRAGLEYGASFATVRQLWTGQPGRADALGRISAVPDGAPHHDHDSRLATLLDGCLQVIAAALGTQFGDALPGAYLPARMDRITLTGALPAQVWAHAHVALDDTATTAVATVRVADDEGTVLAELVGVHLRHTHARTDREPAATPTDRPGDVGQARALLVPRLARQPRQEQLATMTEWVSRVIQDMRGNLAASDAHDVDENDVDENGVAVASLDPSRALVEIGLDSLMATELQRRIQQQLDLRFPAMESLPYQSIDDLAAYLLDRLLAPDTAT